MNAMRLICGGEGGGWPPCRTRLWRERKEEGAEEAELMLQGAHAERIVDELCWVDVEVLLLLQRRRRICCCLA